MSDHEATRLQPPLDLGEGLQHLWDLFDALPSPPGLAIVDRDFRILQANTVHLENWGSIVGEVCYKAYNGFDTPCRWCPVKDARKKRTVCVGKAVSPGKMRNCGQMVHSTVVAVPAHALGNRRSDHVLEIVFDVTHQIAEEARARRERYACLSSLAAVLERVAESSLHPLILLGIVSPTGLRFLRATLLLAKPEHRPMGRQLADKAQRLESFQGIPSLDKVKAGKQEELDRDIARITNRLSSAPLQGRFVASLGEAVGAQKPEVRKWLSQPFPRRWRDNTIASCALFSRGRLYGVLLAEADASKEMISDDMLADFDVFSLMVSQAIERRAIRSTADNLNRIYESLGRDQPGFIANSMMLLAGAHELRRHIRELDDAQQNLSLMAIRLPSLMRSEVQRLCRSASEVKIQAEYLTNLAGLAEPRLQAMSMHNLIEEVVRTWIPRLSGVRADINCQLRATYPVVRADKRLMSIVFANLLSNSEIWLRNVQRQQRAVTIRTSSEEDNLVVSYEDNGAGIDPAFASQIWTPFVTGRGSDGLGIGLSIVKRIVNDMHGGDIRVEANFGRGARFTITLPKYKPRREA